jgi:hypothetical protein
MQQQQIGARVTLNVAPCVIDRRCCFMRLILPEGCL